MNSLSIFIWVYLAMIATAMWESRVEGRNAWDKGKLGWKIKIGKNFKFTEYHFYLWWVMWPMLLILPIVVYGWNLKLLGILISAYFSGLIVEDIAWFAVNPVVKFSEFNPRFANYYRWIGFGKFKIPSIYLAELFIAFLSWYFLWK